MGCSKRDVIELLCLDGREIQSIRVLNNSVFVCCETGVYVSIDTGKQWKSFNDGLINTNVYDVAAIGNEIFIGLYGASVWHRSFSELSVNNQNNHNETSTVSTQNFPNPFSQSTIISFDLPSYSIVSLKIMNALGKEAGTVMSEERLSAGHHEFQWNANELPNGVYFYRLTTDSFSEIKKLILLR